MTEFKILHNLPYELVDIVLSYFEKYYRHKWKSEVMVELANIKRDDPFMTNLYYHINCEGTPIAIHSLQYNNDPDKIIYKPISYIELAGWRHIDGVYNGYCTYALENYIWYGKTPIYPHKTSNQHQSMAPWCFEYKYCYKSFDKKIKIQQTIQETYDILQAEYGPQPIRRTVQQIADMLK